MHGHFLGQVSIFALGKCHMQIDLNRRMRATQYWKRNAQARNTILMNNHLRVGIRTTNTGTQAELNKLSDCVLPNFMRILRGQNNKQQHTMLDNNAHTPYNKRLNNNITHCQNGRTARDWKQTGKPIHPLNYWNWRLRRSSADAVSALGMCIPQYMHTFLYAREWACHLLYDIQLQRC